MSLMTIGIVLLISNALAHFIQVSYLRQEGAEASATGGVLVFGIINAVVALLLFLNFGWAHYLALGFPLIGGLALAASFRNSGGSKALSVLILLLDLALVLIFAYLLFM